MGYADPEAGIGYGYVTNRMGMHLQGDPRDLALRAVIPTTAPHTPESSCLRAIVHDAPARTSHSRRSGTGSYTAQTRRRAVAKAATTGAVDTSLRPCYRVTRAR
jgi:hypothetical protein